MKSFLSAALFTYLLVSLLETLCRPFSNGLRGLGFGNNLNIYENHLRQYLFSTVRGNSPMKWHEAK